MRPPVVTARSTFVQRLAQERPAVEVQRVERKVSERDGVRTRGTTLQPASEGLGVGPALVVRDDQLAVENRTRGHLTGQVVKLREDVGDVRQAAVVEAHAAVPVDEQQTAEAVPLDLEQVL